MIKTSFYLTYQHWETLSPLGFRFTHCPGLLPLPLLSLAMADSAFPHDVSIGGALRLSAQTFLFSLWDFIQIMIYQPYIE